MTSVSTRPVPYGESSNITDRQDTDPHRLRLLAYSRLYRVAQRWRALRAAGTTLLAVTAPWLALSYPATTDALAAASAAWLVLSRTLFSWAEHRATDLAVRTHELYDSDLFNLDWNESLAGDRPLAQQIVDAASKMKRKLHRFDRWYSIDLANVPWPGDVLLCQRQSMTWSRRDHRAYAVLLFITCGLVVLGGLVLASVRNLQLLDYLVKVFLPTAPAVLDTAELGHAHWQHSADGHRAERAERAIEAYYAEHRHDPAGVDSTECRSFQDNLFLLRQATPPVSGLFYFARKHMSNTATRASATLLRTGRSAT